MAAQPDPPPAVCTNCGQPARVLTQGRCSPCHVYWQRQGRERDPGARQRGRPCVECGQPTGGSGRVRCSPCNQQRPWLRRSRDG